MTNESTKRKPRFGMSPWELAQADERAAIVSWLRWEADHRPRVTRQRLRDAAEAIEGGVHREGSQ